MINKWWKTMQCVSFTYHTNVQKSNEKYKWNEQRKKWDIKFTIIFLQVEMVTRDIQEEILRSRKCDGQNGHRKWRWGQYGLQWTLVCTWTLLLRLWSSPQTHTWWRDIASLPTPHPRPSPVLALPTFPAPSNISIIEMCALGTIQIVY